MSSRSRVPVWLVALAGTALAVVAAVALLPGPLARHLTRRALSSLEGVHGTFLNAGFDPLTLTYSLENLKLVADDAGPTDPPLLTVARLHLHLFGRDLLRGRLSASAVIAEAKLTYRLTRGEIASVPDPGAGLGGLQAARLRKVELHDCELLLNDATVSPSAKVWVHQVEAAFEYVATRPGLAWEHAPTFKAHGVVQRSGKFSASGTMDPLASAPTLEGEINLTDLQFSELYGIIVPRTGLQIPKGTVSATATLKASGGRLRGRMQPVFSGLEFRSANGNVFKTVKAGLANAEIGLIPDSFASARPATFDLPWTSPGVLWDQIVTRAQEALLAAIDSAIAGEDPAPPLSSSKGSSTRHKAGAPDGGPRGPAPSAQGGYR
jgi:hypothetical protein